MYSVCTVLYVETLCCVVFGQGREERRVTK